MIVYIEARCDTCGADPLFSERYREAVDRGWSEIAEYWRDLIRDHARTCKPNTQLGRSSSAQGAPAAQETPAIGAPETDKGPTLNRSGPSGGDAATFDRELGNLRGFFGEPSPLSVGGTEVYTNQGRIELCCVAVKEIDFDGTTLRTKCPEHGRQEITPPASGVERPELDALAVNLMCGWCRQHPCICP